MLDQVDSVLAFAIIMLLLSLLITAGVQLLVAVSGLRGRNLLWGVEQLLRQIAPGLGKAEHEDAVAVAARHVLGIPVWATSTNHLTRVIDAVVARVSRAPRALDEGRRPPW